MIDIADQVGLERIVYLGGLGFKESKLSSHLRSRNQVAEILTSGKTVKTTVFRAAMIIGSGSASFEILRYLVDRLPIMITPKWVFTPSQPIAIRNVLNYLVECVEKKETIGLTFDIGGNEVMTYYQLMRIYAATPPIKETTDSDHASHNFYPAGGSVGEMNENLYAASNLGLTDKYTKKEMDTQTIDIISMNTLLGLPQIWG
jgi:hypothetical protein